MKPSLGLLLGAFLVLFGAGGLRGSFGVFIVPWEQGLGSDRGQIALLAAIALLIFGIIQPIAGRAIDRRGPGFVIPAAILLAALGCLLASQSQNAWQLGLSYGLLACGGFGALSNAPLSSIVARHFEGRRGLALGMCSAGTPLGQMILSPGLAVSIQDWGWRPTMIGMALGLALVLLPIAWYFLRREPRRQDSGNVALESGVRVALSSRGYQLLAGSYLLCGATTVGLIQTHFVPHALDLGIPNVVAAQLLGLIGLMNAGGLLFSGWAADRWGARRPLIVVFLVRTLALAWLAVAVDEQMLVAFAVMFGLTDMATIPLVAAGTTSLFGRHSIGALYGLAALGHQIGSALGAWLGGQGYLLWGSYQPVILIGAGVALVAAFMASQIPTVPERAVAVAA